MKKIKSFIGYDIAMKAQEALGLEGNYYRIIIDIGVDKVVAIYTAQFAEEQPLLDLLEIIRKGEDIHE
jgi:hypothetical protein